MMSNCDACQKEAKGLHKAQAIRLLKLDRAIQRTMRELSDLQDARHSHVNEMGFNCGSNQESVRIQVRTDKCYSCKRGFSYVGSFASDYCPECWNKDHPEEEPSKMMVLDLNCSNCGESLVEAINRDIAHRC